MSSSLTPIPLVIAETEEENLKLAAQIAAANLLFAEQAISARVIDPTNMTLNSLIAVADHSYKVSGMQKKQEPKEQTGKFVFNILFSGGKTVTLAPEEHVGASASSPLAMAREAAALVGLPARPDIQFSDSPEFL